MPMSMRRAFINPILARFGYRIERSLRGGLTGEPEKDIAIHLRAIKRPLIIFDVGANVGAFSETIARLLPDGQIHAFEPDARTVELLRSRTAAIPGIRINACALGATRDTATLFGFEHNYMNSLLEPGRTMQWEVQEQSQVDVRTIDEYCAEHSIEHIDLLKIDTQGFDLKVLHGAAGMLSEGRVELILCEIIFADLYEHGARADELMRLLFEHGYELMALYPAHHDQRRAMWTDMLFVRGAPATG